MKPSSRNVNTLPVGVHRLDTGLYLRVTESRRFWIFKYQLNGRRREIGLGGTDQSIAAVQGKAAKMRALIAEGVDPADEKKRRSEAARKTNPKFTDFIPEFLENLQFTRMFTNDHTFYCWTLRMKFWEAEFAGVDLKDVNAERIANALKPIWTTNPRKGNDNLTAIRSYFRYLIGREIVEKNPAEWDGSMSRFLPRISAVRRTMPAKHHSAASAEDLRDAVRKMMQESSTAAKAALVTILTATRSQELRELKWFEVNEKECTATVPTERRKDKKPEPFIVPLPRQAMRIIEGMGTTGSEYVFESETGGSLTKQCVLRVMKKFTGCTLHGVRSTFSDWCAKNGKNFLVSEKCLMHAVGGTVFMAYQRDDLLEQRRVLLQEWADYLFGEDVVE